MIISRIYSAVKVSVRKRRLIFDKISAWWGMDGSNAETKEAYSEPISGQYYNPTFRRGNKPTETVEEMLDEYPYTMRISSLLQAQSTNCKERLESVVGDAVE